MKEAKEVIGMARKTQPFLPCKIIFNSIAINEEKRIAYGFNSFLIDIDTEVAKDILGPTKSFESYVPKSNTNMSTGPISV